MRLETGDMKDKAEFDLRGRKVYIPRMTHSGAVAFAAAFRSVGIDADVPPDSNERTLELGRKFTSGDECYPEQVTLGDLLLVTEMEGFRPERTAFFMPIAKGPCRFGQYGPLLRKILDDQGLHDVMVLSPSSENSYDGVGEHATDLMRTGWRALVAADILRKMLLKTRPYELHPGDTDAAHTQSLEELCSATEQQEVSHKRRLTDMADALIRARDRFRGIPANYDRERPLIGVVGEIFCRLNRFSNEELIRKIEEFGGECWLSDISEWLWYTNNEQLTNLRHDGKRFSTDMAVAKLKMWIQRRDEHALLAPFHEDFRGYEEPHDIHIVLDNSVPYLPYWGVLGEMVLSIGKTIYLHDKGADGIVDISPFTCMNGITSEAIYPKVSREHDGIPIRNFYFDGTQSDLDRDVGIFIELARSYRRRKTKERVYPFTFG